MLKERILSAVVLIPLAFALLYLGGWWFTALVVLFGILASYEAYAMLRRKGYRPFTYWGMAVVVGLVLLVARDPQERWLPHALTLVVLLTLVRALAHRTEAPATDWALTVAVALYLGGLMRYALLLREYTNGLQWVVAALLTTWITDTGAYFVGLSIGKHRMAPRLSPKKTWEGAIGGWIIGVLGAVLVGWVLLPFLTLWQMVVLGVVVSTVAPFGDLAESMFKRQCGVKDSGNLIPGHGGALDRIDSLLFVFPVVYWLAVWWG